MDTHTNNEQTEKDGKLQASIIHYNNALHKQIRGRILCISDGVGPGSPFPTLSINFRVNNRKNQTKFNGLVFACSVHWSLAFIFLPIWHPN